MKKTIKQPKDMTTDEALEHLFTAKGAKIIKEHVAKISEGKKRPKK
jgi:hypothetical protein